MIELDSSGRINENISSVSDFYRSPRMPYEFTSLTADDMAQESARVKKELERQLYGAILKMGEDPSTYATESHSVPDDEFSEHYAIKVDIARILSNISFINNL